MSFREKKWKSACSFRESQERQNVLQMCNYSEEVSGTAEGRRLGMERERAEC